MRLYPLPLVFLLSACALAAEPARDGFDDPLPTGAVQRLSGLHLRHPATALDPAFSPDGKTLATASADGNIYLWDPVKGKKVRTLSTKCPAGISALRWMDGGKTLCAAGRDGVLHILDVAGAAQRRLGSERIPLTGLEVSDGGKTLLTVNQQGRVRVCDVGGDKPRREYAGQPGASLIALTPDDTHILYTEPGGNLRLVEIRSGKEVRTFTADAPPSGPRAPKRPRVAKMALSSDGKQFAYSDWRNHIHVYALKSGEPIQRIDQRSGGISDLAFAPGGQVLAVASGFGVHLYGIASGRELRGLEAMPVSMIHVAFSPDGKTLAGLALDSGLHLWDVYVGRERFTPEGHGSAITDLLFLPDGRRLVSHGADGQLCLWDLRTGRMLVESRGRKAFPRSLIADEDGLAVRFVGLNQGIESWDLGRDPNQRISVVVIPRPDCAAASPDGKTLALATHDHQLQLRQPGRSTPRTLDAPTKPWNALRFSPDNRLLIGANADGSLRLWHRIAAEVVRRLREPGAAGVRWLEFAADGRSILIFNGALRVVETATGQERIAVPIKTANGAKAYSSDGRWAAIAAPDGCIRVYDLGDGSEVGHFHSPRGSVAALAFRPDSDETLHVRISVIGACQRILATLA